MSTTVTPQLEPDVLRGRIGRFREVPWNEREFLEATGMPPGAFERWLTSEKEKITSISARYRPLKDGNGESVVEFDLVMTDGKNHCRRVLMGEGKVEEAARILVRELEAQSGFTIPYTAEE